MVFHIFFQICFRHFSTEESLKAFICTRMRAESLDWQHIFYYETNGIREFNDFPPILPQAMFAIKQPLNHLYATASTPRVWTGSHFLL